LEFAPYLRPNEKNSIDNQFIKYIYLSPARTQANKAKRSKILKVADFQDFFFLKKEQNRAKKKQLRRFFHLIAFANV